SAPGATEVAAISAPVATLDPQTLAAGEEATELVPERMPQRNKLAVFGWAVLLLALLGGAGVLAYTAAIGNRDDAPQASAAGSMTEPAQAGSQVAVVAPPVTPAQPVVEPAGSAAVAPAMVVDQGSDWAVTDV